MDRCRNCQTPLEGEFCSHCGQRNIDLQQPIQVLLGDVIRETFEVDGRAVTTVAALFRYPGKLTADFLEGRRVAYSPPLRLYLIFSIVFFLLVSWFASSAVLQEPGADPVFDAAVQARFLSDDLPTLMFLLLPVFALLLKAMYWQRLYFDHLIFSLHLHCVAYVAFVIMLPLEVVATRHVALLVIQVVTFTSFLAYFAMALKRVYGGGWLGTSLRTTLVLLVYITVVSLAIELSTEATIILD